MYSGDPDSGCVAEMLSKYAKLDQLNQFDTTSQRYGVSSGLFDNTGSMGTARIVGGCRILGRSNLL